MIAIERIQKLTRGLYPSGRAFRMPWGGDLQKLHDGLAISELQAVNDGLSTFDSMFPDNSNFTADDATMWERRLGLITNTALSLDVRMAAILRKMRHPGSVQARQSAACIEGQLQIADFDVNVFESAADVEIGSWQATDAGGGTWTSIVFAKGLFVAVTSSGTGNRVSTSLDGLTWTPRVSAADNNWNSVTFGRGIFVAVAVTGTGNRVMTSPDGITWTSRVSAADNDWTSVTYGNGLFVAVALSGTGDRVMTSPDGITWTSRTSAADNAWFDVTFGNNLFVAVAASGVGNRIMTSPDGITWTIRVSAADNVWESVRYGNGMFVAIASNFDSPEVMTSPDGITWTARIVNFKNNWRMEFGNGVFVAGSNTGGGAMMMSNDGINWYKKRISDGGGRVLCVNDGLAIATNLSALMIALDLGARHTVLNKIDAGKELVTFSSKKSFIIADDVAAFDWQVQVTPSNFQVYDITFGFVNGAPLFIACGPVGGNAGIMTSPDGITWTSRVVPTANNSWTCVRFGYGALGVLMIVSVSAEGNIITSPDGVTWTARTSPSATAWNSIAFRDRLFVVTGGAGTSRIMTSPDGITWTLRTTPNVTLTNIVFAKGLFVAVVSGGGVSSILTSPDGITWTLRTTPNLSFRAIQFGQDKFIITQFGGTAWATSPDGITWTLQASALPGPIFSLAFGNGYFLGVSSTAIIKSDDGRTWSSVTLPPGKSFAGVGYGINKFVAGATDAAVTDNIFTAVLVDFAEVDADRETEFRQIIVKIKPAQSVAFLFVDYV